MRVLLGLLLLVAFNLFTSCDKDDNPTNPDCSDLVTDTAGTGDNGRVYMPNAFTPNGDGINDIARPLTFNIASINFTLYDNQNNIVFNTTTLGRGWNTIAAMGNALYYFKIQASTNAGHKIGLCGTINKLSCYPNGTSASSFYFEDQLTPFGFTGVTHETLVSCP